MLPQLSGAPGVAGREVRVLEGPNLYFPRPAVKVTLAAPGLSAADEATVRRVADELGMPRGAVGAPGTATRQRALARLAERVVRRLAEAGGTSRLGVRSRTAGEVDTVVVAFVWRRRGPAEALGEAVAPVLRSLLAGEPLATALAPGAERVRTAADGEPAQVLVPRVPVAAVTGTNGKTTTTRLLAHLGMTAGRRTGWSSTDGIVVQGEVVEPGDYSGPAGARGVLRADGVELGILETARGGILLRGLGVTANDVSVVTNVSADHLGLQGIDTVDQLAEVKAVVTRVTRPGGWAVLNGEDPRVWAMRAGTRGRPWAFTLDPDAPAVREALGAGGRATTILDGSLCVLRPGRAPDRLLPVVDVPVTLAGLSRHNVANALAAASAGLALGLPREAVVEGLRSFVPDTRLNPGRLNVFTVPLPAHDGSATVVVDLAHNEAGLEALLDVARGLTAPGGRVRLGLGTGGDRTDEILEGLGELAGLRADHVVVTHKEHYLRGRTTAELERHLRTGLARAGVHEVASYGTELDGLQALVAGAGDGDVVALMTHAERESAVRWLQSVGATADGPSVVRRKVLAARGGHEAEAEVTALWQLADPAARVAAAQDLVGAHPGDPRLLFELASALDAAEREAEAETAYRHALGSGLGEPHRHRARVQLAATLRRLGRAEEAVRLLDEVAGERPDVAAVAAFRALCLVDLGRAEEAVADLVDALATAAPEEETAAWSGALHRYAGRLRSR
ncbi:MAG TPA: tetratricopeptide repeat protein [Dermatophilaceae bacterium]|nr:tetratricopeptide repeat protein [Dermatophilaceae bacterium]